MLGHRLADTRSRALHRAIADRLVEDPGILERARERVRAWGEEAGAHPHYVEAWTAVLARSLDEVAAFLVEDSEQARELRQMTPFSGVLAPRERWRILREMRTSERRTRAVPRGS